MRLWSIQKKSIWAVLEKEGVYRCKPQGVSLDYEYEYRWMMECMAARIGPRPADAAYPIWAWYMQDKRRRPDLRRERWLWDSPGVDFACIEMEVPDEQVLLSDLDAWTIILNDGLLSDTEAENDALWAQYNALPLGEKRAFQRENWQRVFDIRPLDNDWIRRGDWVQATLWELRREYVQNVRFFKSARRRA